MNVAIQALGNEFRRIADQYHRGRPMALLFDFDGTLTPIVRHPSLARLPDPTRRQLEAFAALPRVGVGVISGRALGELRGLVGADGFFLAGSGGLEVEVRGTTRRDPCIAAVTKLFDVLEGTLIDILRCHPLTWLERKPGALSIHYRGLPPLAAAGFRVEVANALSAFESLRFRVVSEAIEVTPAQGWDKGDTVAAILNDMNQTYGEDSFAVYFGDAPNDTEAMLVADESGGVSIGIGDDAPPTARLHLPDASLLPEGLNLLMRQMLKEGTSHDVVPLEQPEPACKLGDLLILDPNPASRTKLAAELEGHGWRVWQSDTPAQARDHIQDHGHTIRVALVDLELPGLQSAKAIAEFERARPGILRCYMASDIRPDTAAAFTEISNKPLFVKPIQPAEIVQALEKLLQERLV